MKINKKKEKDFHLFIFIALKNAGLSVWFELEVAAVLSIQPFKK